jgi:hypothetical protein
MDNIETNFFSFDVNIEVETEINTEVELVAKKINNIEITDNKTEKLKIKLLSNDTPTIFTKVKQLYEYIKLNSVKENDYYIFKIKKNYYNLMIKMRSPKHILNYILTYHVEYDIL